MKAVLLTVLGVLLFAFAQANTPTAEERLAGLYCWSVPGSTWMLALRLGGTYTLVNSTFNQEEKPIESGEWRFDGFIVLLQSKQAPVGGGDGYRRLHVLEKKSGHLMLVSAVRSEAYAGQPCSGDTLFDYVFIQCESTGAIETKRANQALLPTPTAVTDRAAHAPRQP